MHAAGPKAVAVALLLLFPGCGSGLVQVEGTVLLDSRPLPDAQVLFYPKSGGRPASGKTDAAGKFSLTTAQPGDGALPGEYEVAVTASKVAYVRPSDGSDHAQQETWIAPQRYSKTSTSGLTATVGPDQRTPKLELTSK